MIARNTGIEYDINPYSADEIVMEETVFLETGGDLDSILDLVYKRRGDISPLSVTWELTDSCNFNCPFCYVHNHTGDIDINDKWTYRFEDIKKDIDDLVEAGLMICYLSGGECILHPDFETIYKYLKRKGVLVAVLTNASLITSDHMKLFEKYKPYKVEVSVYGITDTFSVSDSKKCAKKVLDNILEMKKRGIRVVAKTPFNKCTEAEFEAVRGWCQKHNVEYYYSDELFQAYDGTGFEALMQVLPEPKEDMQAKDEVEYKKVFDCVAGKYSFLISYDKTIRPCFAFYKTTAPQWNFRYDEGDLLKAYIQMAEKIKAIKGKRLRFCSGCRASGACQECIATQCNANGDLKKYMYSKCKKNKI